MTGESRNFQARCSRVLRAHIADQSEATRNAAYELGREALAADLGVVEMAAILHESISDVLLERDPKRRDREFAALGSFMLEVLSPFEMAHRGAREANTALRRVGERREEDLSRIAHSIHDDVGQHVAFVHWALADALRGVPQAERGRFAAVTERLRDVEERLRRLSHELRPTILDDLGLDAALATLASNVAGRSGLAVRVEGASIGRLPGPIETVLYRTVQEALSNVVRHAKATHAIVRLEREPGEVRCTIRDDGVGFAHAPGAGGAAGGAPRGLGLLGIRERVAHVGGSVKIRTEPGRGTEIFVPIPLEMPHAGSNRTSR